MKTPHKLTNVLFLLVGWFVSSSTLFAQQPDAAKIAEFEARFKQGQQLEQSGDLAGARAVFEKIISESPEAKGSLREAGLIALEQGDLKAAEAHFEALHKLVPSYPAAYEYLIQVNQALKRDIKVLRLIKEFRALHEQGSPGFPDFATSFFFVRERTKHGNNSVIFSEFFDYTAEPNTVWMAEEVTPGKKLVHRLLLNYDPEATEKLHAKDPRLAQAQEFLLLEQVMDDEKLKAISVYKQLFALPDYQKIRDTMMAILDNPPAPIYTSSVPQK